MSLFRWAGISSIRRVISAGSDNAAPPIRDLHGEVEEKGLIGVLKNRAGIRKAGRNAEAPGGATYRRLDLIIMMGKSG